MTLRTQVAQHADARQMAELDKLLVGDLLLLLSPPLLAFSLSLSPSLSYTHMHTPACLLAISFMHYVYLHARVCACEYVYMHACMQSPVHVVIARK